MPRPITVSTLGIDADQPISLNQFRIHKASVLMKREQGYVTVQTQLLVADWETGATREVIFSMPVDDFRILGRLSEADTAEIVRGAVINALVHELDEHLTWCGDRRWNPHAGGLSHERMVPESQVHALEVRVRQLRNEVDALRGRATPLDLDLVRQQLKEEDPR